MSSNTATRYAILDLGTQPAYIATLVTEGDVGDSDPADAGLAGTRVTASWADVVDSRVGQLVIAALEPPDAVTADDGSVDEREPPE